eukprot:SAG11_NODE_7680_length_1111_cov_1.035573_1_plen_170_part_00
MTAASRGVMIARNFVLPFLTPWFLAAHRLMTTINDLLLDCNSVEEEAKVYHLTAPLLATMRGTNGGQGLGFVSFGIVLDTKTLSKIAIGITSVFGTIVPLVLALHQEEGLLLGADSSGCASISETQESTLVALRSANTSCFVRCDARPSEAHTQTVFDSNSQRLSPMVD